MKPDNMNLISYLQTRLLLIRADILIEELRIVQDDIRLRELALRQEALIAAIQAWQKVHIIRKKP